MTDPQEKTGPGWRLLRLVFLVVFMNRAAVVFGSIVWYVIGIFLGTLIPVWWLLLTGWVAMGLAFGYRYVTTGSR